MPVPLLVAAAVALGAWYLTGGSNERKNTNVGDGSRGDRRRKPRTRRPSPHRPGDDVKGKSRGRTAEQEQSHGVRDGAGDHLPREHDGPAPADPGRVGHGTPTPVAPAPQVGAEEGPVQEAQALEAPRAPEG